MIHPDPTVDAIADVGALAFAVPVALVRAELADIDRELTTLPIRDPFGYRARCGALVLRKRAVQACLAHRLELWRLAESEKGTP